MDFDFTEEQKLLRTGVRELLRKECPREMVRLWDSQGMWPAPLYDVLARHGYLGVGVDPRYGGSGGDIVSQAIVCEELAYAAQSCAIPWLNTVCFGGQSIMSVGTEEQKSFFLPPLCRGEMRFAISITEPGGGTDVLSHLDTRAWRENGHWVIQGRKIFTTGADIAHYLLVLARTTPRSLVSKPAEGVTLFLVSTQSVGLSLREVDVITFRCIKTFEVAYDRVAVDDFHVLGHPDEGWSAILHTLNNERILLAALNVGIAQAALDDAIAYAKQREAFGRPIAAFQRIAHYLAEAYIAVDTARLATYRAAWMQAKGLPCGVEATLAKLVAAEAAWRAADSGMQVMGGYGFATDSDMQRYWRDARLARIGPVTNEMALNIVAKALGLPRAW
ncbi:MAG TPA: acyl-CoA dehydrogenase family protein [Dehalococcoidia bacterium]|nr:acyl-CoA dehydrogenase family protein [Dehalococcoidia bacterium]